jgi:hypothetical protein
MLRIITLLISLVLLIITPDQSSGGQTVTDLLLPACPKKTQCGFIDRNGKMVIKPQFLEARNFHEGLAAVKIKTANGERWGYIDATGAVVIPPQFEESSDFSDGLARFGVNVKNPLADKYGFVDRTGRVVIEPTYRHVEPFSEGLATIAVPYPSSSPGSYGGFSYKVGFINTKGDFVIPDQFYIAKSFSEGLAVACNGKFRASKCGFIDKFGKWAIEPKFDFDEVQSFSDGLAAIEVNNKWGYIDKTGMVIIEPQYDEAKRFSEGLAVVASYKRVAGRLNGYDFIGYIDKTGRAIIPLKYGYDDEFSEGFAVISTEGGHAYIDRTGKRISKRSYYEAGQFTNGIAVVYKANLIGHLSATLEAGPLGGLAVMKKCYIDKSEKIIWEEKTH